MVAAILVATGKTPSHIGFDPMKPVGDVSAVQRLILTFQQAGAKRIVVIAGEWQTELEKHLARMGVVCLQGNQDAKADMFQNIKQGVAYLKGKCNHVFITPVDIPLFSTETIREMLAKKNASAVVPNIDGKNGHPLLVGKELFSWILKYEGDGGLAGAVWASGKEVTQVMVKDRGVLLNIRKEQDFTELVEKHSLRALRPKVKLTLARETSFHGPGTQQLLQLIKETGSLRLACTEMGISYSKGWKMIREIEKQWQAPVLERQQGGKSGGGSLLTIEGENLLQAYDAFYSACMENVQMLFEKYFPMNENQ